MTTALDVIVEGDEPPADEGERAAWEARQRALAAMRQDLIMGANERWAALLDRLRDPTHEGGST